MAQPTRYTRRYSATSWAIGHPTVPQPGSSLDAEFNAIKTTLDEVLVNLALIQADDGGVANQTIGIDQLKTELTLGIEAPTVWATDTAYAVNNTVTHNNSIYRCAEAHTSGTFATDLAANKWVLLASFVGGLGAVESVNGSTGDVVLDADDIDDTSTTNKFATAAQLSKLDAVESGATADQTGAEIKALYEAESDTNAFTDAEKSKLAAIEAGADVTDATNVQAAGALMDSELASVASVKALDQGVATADSPTFAALTIDSTNAQFTLDKAASGDYAQLTGSTGGLTRWGIQLGDTASESGSNAGSNFQIARYADDGSYIGPVMYISRSNGYVNLPGAYNETTATAANVVITSDGSIQRSTSSRRYKDDITNMEFGIDMALAMRPVTYRQMGHGPRRYAGFIAEDVHALGLKEFVEYDTDGRPDSLNYGHMVALCIKAIQDLSRRIDALEGA